MPSEQPKLKVTVNGTAIALAVAALVAFYLGAAEAAWALVWVYLVGILAVAVAVAWIGASQNRGPSSWKQ